MRTGSVVVISVVLVESLIFSVGYKFLDFKRDFGDNQLDLLKRGPFVAGTVRC